jgi:hypothetical protein
VELTAEADLGYAAAGKKPPKGVLNWVAAPAPGQEPERAEVGDARGVGEGGGGTVLTGCFWEQVHGGQGLWGGSRQHDLHILAGSRHESGLVLPGGRGRSHGGHLLVALCMTHTPCAMHHSTFPLTAMRLLLAAPPLTPLPLLLSPLCCPGAAV